MCVHTLNDKELNNLEADCVNANVSFFCKKHNFVSNTIKVSKTHLANSKDK